MTKALLVEDDPKLSRLIAQFLEQHGFNVAQAYRCLLYTSDAADE